MSGRSTLPPEKESAKRVCTRLLHAYRGFRLYPADHPTARHTLEEFVTTLTSHLDERGSLVLQVEENRLIFQDETVYTQEEGRGNLAFLLFRDGIRFLTFHPGIDPSEAEALIDCLAHADDLASMEYDLTTAFWERQLPHVEYEAVDPFLGAGGEGLRAGALNDLRETVVRRLSELTPGIGDMTPGPLGGGGNRDIGTVDGSAAEAGGFFGAELEDLRAESMALSKEDLEYGEYALGDLGDALGDFALVLLEIAGNPARPSTGEETLARSLTMVTEQFLDRGNVRGLGVVVDRLQALESQGRRPPQFAREVIGVATTTDRLTRLIEGMAQAAPEEAARTEELLGKMRDWVFPSLLEILAESSDKGVRKTVLALLDLKEGVPIEHLWPLMYDPRWYVVRNAVQLATHSGDPELVDHLKRLVRHPDARVRREVMRSLDTFGGGRAAALLAQGLGDEDSSVRILAARGLGRHGSRGQIAPVQAVVESRDFETRPPEEITEFLFAFACLGGEATVDVLNKMWKRRLIGTRPMPVRIAAIQALAAVACPSARRALAEAAKSGDAQLQRVAVRALHEPRTRMVG